jgi:protein arginine kinase activator
MRCDLCKKGKAAVHITQHPMRGDMVRINLCQPCARKHGVDDPTGFSLADLLCVLGKKPIGPD